MTVNEFFDKWNGKGVDTDGYYGFQCLDLAHQYAVDVVGHDFPPEPAAKDVWGLDLPDYDKVTNTPDGIPQKGDIIIWGTGIGQYGHIAVFDHGDNNSFTSFDQNWPLNSLCHYQNHNYNGVLGWFHPKNAVITQPTPQPNSMIYPSIISEIYQGILGLAPSVDEVSARVGQLNSGTVLHDIVSQVLNEDGRSPLIITKENLDNLKEQNRLLVLSNETLTKKLQGSTNPSTSSNSAPTFIPTTSLGKLFLRLAQALG